MARDLSFIANEMHRRLVHAFINEGKTLAEIEKWSGCSNPYPSQLAKRYGISSGRTSGRKPTVVMPKSADRVPRHYTPKPTAEPDPEPPAPRIDAAEVIRLRGRNLSGYRIAALLRAPYREIDRIIAEHEASQCASSSCSA